MRHARDLDHALEIRDEHDVIIVTRRPDTGAVTSYAVVDSREWQRMYLYDTRGYEEYTFFSAAIDAIRDTREELRKWN